MKTPLRIFVDAILAISIGCVAIIAFRTGAIWAMIVLYIGLMVGIARLDDWLEDYKQLKRDINYLRQRVNTIDEFFCESKLLKEEVDVFQESDHAPYHGLGRRRSRDPECRCGVTTSRVNAALNQNGFYTYLYEKNPEKYAIEPDGADEYRNDEFRKRLHQRVLPIFQRLHKSEPKAFPKEHIDWLIRPKADIRDFRNYMTWLIPSLEREIFDPIKTEQGEAALSELKSETNLENPQNIYSW